MKRKVEQSEEGTLATRHEVEKPTGKITRRAALIGIPAAGALFLPCAGIAATSAEIERQARSAATPDWIRVSDHDGIVETSSGKIRGLQRNGIYIFRDVPYGADTSGQNRFLPAKRPVSWAGIRSCLWYGPVCPFPKRQEWTHDEASFLLQWNDGQPGEDCLRVNIWTPEANDNQKRPVMVWIHGGGYGWGSGQELPSYEGENLCHRGDVVVVTLNHRVNAFGFLNLSHYDDGFRDSANIGMLDLVFALEWIRDNIRQFGGDPENILIFGQSGGGGKVSTLMTMPSARGLYHKAAVQSGSILYSKTEETSQRLTDEILKELGISKNTLNRLHDISADELLAASARAQKNLAGPPSPKDSLGPDFAVFSRSPAWSPVADGNHIPTVKWDARSSSKIPLLVGSTLNEFYSGVDRPDAFAMREDEIEPKLTPVYGSRSREIIAAFRSTHPTANPFQLLSIIATQGVRNAAVEQARSKAAVGEAPAYLYLFAWQTAVLDGRPLAFHSADLPFCWDNTDRCASATGGGNRARTLAAKMSQAWINFARSGDPNHGDLPKWTPVSPDAAQTMVFDDICRLELDPDQRERELTVAPTTE